MSTFRLYERHIDRVLSEELEASPEFISWFVQKVFKENAPSTIPTSCTTTIGHHRIEGETDIRITIGWETGANAVIHVEDKLLAIPQPDQALRYQRAKQCEKSNHCACVIVAPLAWLQRHVIESAHYDERIELEEIAKQLLYRSEKLEKINTPLAKELSKRLRWRGEVLSGSAQRRQIREALPANDLTNWNRDAAAVIEAKNGLILAMSERQRSSGRTKTSRFFRFQESLSPYRNGKCPIIKLKTVDANSVARVSLEILDASDDGGLQQKAAMAGFQLSTTAIGTLVISSTTDTLKELSINKPVVYQVQMLEDAADVAQKLIVWWVNQQSMPDPERPRNDNVINWNSSQN